MVSRKTLIWTAGLLFAAWAVVAEGTAAKKFKILILGDSLTEGYGVEKDDAFPARLDAELKQWQDRFQVLNGGSSGSTSASGVRRLKWYGKNEPDLVILALGSNDGLRGVKPEETRKNVEAAILFCREKKWPVIVAGLKMPPNYGPEYTKAFERIYPELAAKYKAPLVGFLLQGVAGEPELNQADGMHPNERGHQIIADNLFRFLKPILSAQR
jgi:acyl-CoA thioesterase-1